MTELLDPDKGEVISRRDVRSVVILADGPDLTVTWSRYSPGERGPDLHVHHEHTDAFYILDGELTFALGPGGERVVAGAGTFVAVPPNVAHGFANEGDVEARWLNVHAPDAGFAAYMRGARDGADVAFDSYDVPADGGLPPSEAILVRPGDAPLDVRVPHLRVTVADGGQPATGLRYPLADGVLELLPQR